VMRSARQAIRRPAIHDLSKMFLLRKRAVHTTWSTPKGQTFIKLVGR
jgi:hypothetical protein